MQTFPNAILTYRHRCCLFRDSIELARVDGYRRIRYQTKTNRTPDHGSGGIQQAGCIYKTYSNKPLATDNHLAKQTSTNPFTNSRKLGKTCRVSLPSHQIIRQLVTESIMCLAQEHDKRFMQRSIAAAGPLYEFTVLGATYVCRVSFTWCTDWKAFIFGKHKPAPATFSP